MSILTKQNTEDIFGITPLQEGLLFHYLKHEGESTQNFEQICLYMSGSLDFQKIVSAWSTVVRQNEMLRTVFRWKKLSKPVQITLKEAAPNIRLEDLSGFSKEKQDQLVKEIQQKDKASLFDLEKVPFRVCIIKTDENHFIMMLSNHSIIYDGWSNGVMLKEFFKGYLALMKGQTSHLAEKLKFKNHLKWIKSTRNDEKEAAFWNDYLRDLQEDVSLQIKTTESEGAATYSICSDHVVASEAAKIDAFCLQNRLTKAAVLYAAWGILLQKISDSRDVMFGTTVSGRSHGNAGIGEVVGLLINTLPLRVKDAGDTLMELMQSIAGHLVDRQSFEQTPLVKIKDYSGQTQNTDLFDSIVLIENYPLDQKLFKSDDLLKVESFTFDQTNNFDLALSIVDFETDLELYLEYNDTKFDHSTIGQLLSYFRKIIDELIHHPSKTIAQVEIISPEEKQEVVYSLNDTALPYSDGHLMHQLFEEMVALYPDQIAVTTGTTNLTYYELNQRANALALRIDSVVTETNTLIPVIMDRSPEMIVAVMAVLKAGHAYVPLDHTLPAGRLTKLLQDIAPYCLVTHSAVYDTVAQLVPACNLLKRLFVVEETAKQVASMDHPLVEHLLFDEIDLNVENLPAKVNNEALAYIIYTSGSTGIPKGVVVQHKPVINIIQWINRTMDIGLSDKLLFITSMGFDLSVYDIFGTLAAGATIRLSSSEERRSPEKLLQIIAEEDITVWDSAPPVFHQLIQYAEILEKEVTQSRLKVAMLSGDWIPLQLPEKANTLFGGVEVVSLGGATEAVIWSNYFQFEKVLPDWTSIPYGRPVQNAKYYVLDKDLLPLPKGIIGELFIGGECLALGYFNDEKLTQSKFLPNPYAEGRIYRTGDLARLMEDGNIELIGRVDHQVKIRGLRVELGEIENRLNQYQLLRECAVLAGKDPNGQNFICAFYVSDSEVDAQQLKDFLAEELPEYMIPAYLIPVDQMPITANGKLDRKSLFALVNHGADEAVDRNKSAHEEVLATIWADVLQLPAAQINASSDFFEIGGHSLNATILQAKVEKQHHVVMSLRQIFSKSKLRDMATLLTADSVDEVVITRVAPQPFYPATSGQRRLFALQQLDETSTSYNISGCVQVNGVIDHQKVKSAMEAIVRTQEAFRTTFTTINHQLVQRITDTAEVTVDIIVSEKEHIGFHDYVRPFDLENGPLFRVSIIKTPTESLNYLLFDIHHIISDGLSMKCIIEDFIVSYQRKEIASPALQYKDYAAWLQSEAYGKLLQSQEQYWTQTFENGFSRLALPVDYKRSELLDDDGGEVIRTLTVQQSEALQALMKGANVTAFSMFITLLSTLLSRICQSEEVIIGTPVVNRPHDDLMKIVGFFTNMLPIVNQIGPEQSFSSQLQQVHQKVLRALENQQYLFEDLVNKVEPQRKPGHNPIFDVVLEFDNLDMPGLTLDKASVDFVSQHSQKSKFDLLLQVAPSEESFRLRFQYRKCLFEASTIQWMMDSLLALIDDVVAEPEVKIHALNSHEKRSSSEQIEFEF